MKYLVSLICVVLAGCSVGETTDREIPKGWRAFETGAGRVTFLIPVTMEDGTKCVVVSGNSAGYGITCDWSKP
jgi:hypothetical protein